MTRTVQSLWVGTRISLLEHISIASFLAAGHEYLLYAYNDIDGLPSGVTLKDANEILPESAVFTHRSGSLALFADLFRWEMLKLKGGYWVDTDMICLKPFDFKSDIVFGKETDTRINTAVLKFPAQHPICDLMLERCREPNKIQGCDDNRARKRKWKRKLLFQDFHHAKWGELGGPIGFTLAVMHLGLFDKALPFTAFYPFSPHNWNCLIDETFSTDQSYFSQSYGIHLWTEMMRREDFSKDGPYPEGSLMHQLAIRFADITKIGEPKSKEQPSSSTSIRQGLDIQRD